MKSKHTDLEQRYMMLFKIDAYNLFSRIKERQHEYIEIFSLKRSRSIFKDIFENRYAKASIFDLSHCTQEVIEALDQFYNAADNLYWYLKHTQDMPNTIEDEVSRKVTKLQKKFELLSLYVDAELSGESSGEAENFEDIPPNDVHEDYFHLDGEKQAYDSESDFLQPEHFPDPEELADFEEDQDKAD